jgi:hypothetical protein
MRVAITEMDMGSLVELFYHTRGMSSPGDGMVS